MDRRPTPFRRALLLTTLILTLLLGAALGGSFWLQPFIDRDDGPRLSLGRATPVGLPGGPPETLFSRVFDLVSPSVPFLLIEDGGGRRSGSGLVIHEAGFIVTNAHVVDGASRVQVLFEDGLELVGHVYGSDRYTDLAVIKVDSPRPLPVAPLGDSDRLRVGEFVMALGAPFGLRATGTRGIVSGLDRRGLGIATYERFIVTDAAINRGNSGGPLVNARGEVVGINTAMISGRRDREGFASVGFAIPVNLVRTVAGDLIGDGGLVRAWAGLMGMAVDARRAASLGMERARGFLVLDVDEEGPARRAGLRVGDVVLTIDGDEVDGDDEWREALSRREPGSEVRLEVFREGERLSLALELDAWPPADDAARPGDGTRDPVAGPGGDAERPGAVAAARRAAARSARIPAATATPAAGPTPAPVGATLPRRPHPSRSPVVHLEALDGEGQRLSRGSGLVMDGYVLTNAHVVEDAVAVRMIKEGHAPLLGTVVGADARIDLAAVRFDAPVPVAPAELGEAGGLQVGDRVLALGAAPDGTTSASPGEVLEPLVFVQGAPTTLEVIRSTNVVESGFSGGPLLHEDRAVGIITFRDQRLDGALSIPIQEAARFGRELAETGLVRRVNFGAAIRERAGEDPESSVLVLSVAADSPAARAGLRQFDEIMSVNGRPAAEVWRKIQFQEPGTRLGLEIRRGGNVLTTTVILEENAGGAQGTTGR